MIQVLIEVRLTYVRYSVKLMPTLACRDEVGYPESFSSRHADLDKVLRDVRDRGRDVEGIMKQWFGFVKPNFEKVRELGRFDVLWADEI